MATTRVFVDANVIRSKTLRDWLFLLRNAGDLYTVCTTEDVIAEAVYTLRRDKPKAPGHLTRAVHDQIVDSLDERVEDFPEDAAGYPGEDPNDLHVHSAAVASGVDKLITADTGFTKLSQDAQDMLPYEIYHPDEFFTLVDDSAPALVRTVAQRQLDYWCARPPSGGVNLVRSLEKAECPTFAERVRLRLQEL